MKTRILFLLFCIILFSISVSGLQTKEKHIFEGNKVYVNHSKGIVGQEPFMITPNQKATITFSNKGTEKSYNLCYDFKGEKERVKINEVKKKGFLGVFNTDLTKVTTKGGYVCTKSFSNDNEADIEFSAVYGGYGTLKYDVLIIPEKYNLDFKAARLNDDLIILDPYLIGNLSNPPTQLLYLPFDGDIDDDSGIWSYNTTIPLVSFAAQATSTVYKSVRNITVNTYIDSAKSEVNYTYIGPSSTTAENCLIFQFYYTNGSQSNTSAQCNLGAGVDLKTNVTKDNPNPNQLVSKIETLLSTDAWNKMRTLEFISWNALSNPNNITFYQYGVTGYDFSLEQDSHDIFNSYDGVDTTIVYNLSGANFPIAGGGWINTTLNTSSEDKSIYAKFFYHDTASYGNPRVISKNQELEMFIIDGTDKLWCICWDGTQSRLSGNGAVTPGVLTSAACTYNATTKNMTAYVNGVVVDSDIIAAGCVNDTKYYTIGRQSGGTEYFNGTIEKVMIYNRALTQAEVSALEEPGWFTTNVVSESNKALYENNSYITTTNITDTIVTTSFWYTVGSSWKHIVNVSGSCYTNAVSSSCPTDYPISYANNRISTKPAYNGSIDDLIVYNYALTSSEIEQLYGGYNNSLNMTFYDIETKDLITEEITVEVFNTDNTYSEVFYTNTGNLYINGLGSDTFTLTYYSDSYDPNVITRELSTANTQYNLTLYMTNSSSSNTGNLFTYTFNQDYYAIKNADVRLQQYFPDLGEFIEISQCYSDSNGECVFNIVLGTIRYIVTSQATINNITSTTRSSTTGNFYPIDNTEIELYLTFSDQYTVPDDFGLSITPYNTSLVGNTSYLYADFIDVNGNSHTVCIGYYFNNVSNITLGAEDCTTGASGTVGLTSSYLLNRDYTWTAKIYTKEDGNILKLYYSYIYLKTQSFKDEFDLYLIPLIILSMAVLLGFAIQLKNILIFPIGMIPVLLLNGFLKPSIFTIPVLSIQIFILVMLIYVGRKTSDNEAS